MDLQVYFVIFAFILMLLLIAKIVIEISHARKNIISISSDLDDATEEIVSLKKDINLLKNQNNR